MKKIIIALCAAALLVVLGFFFSLGIDKNERVECIKWQKQAQQFPGFYATEWQKAQCTAHDISL